MTAQPEKYVVIAPAAWDTDIFMNAVLANKIDDACIEFTNTTPAAPPGMEYADFIPVETGAPYSLFAWMQADSVVALNVLGLLVDWYDDDEVFDSTTAAYNAVLPGINTWYRLGAIFEAPINARFAKPRIAKNNTAFKGYFDDVHFAEMPIAVWAHANVGTIISNVAPIKINLQTEIHDYGSNFAGSTFTAPSNGLYSFAARVSAQTALAADPLEAYLYIAGGASVIQGKSDYGGAAIKDAIVNVNGMLLVRGDTVELYAMSVGGSAPTNACLVGKGETFLMGGRVD